MKIKMYENMILVDINGNVKKGIGEVEFLNTTELKKFLQATKSVRKHRLCDNTKCQPGVGLAANAATHWTDFMSNVITIDQFKD